MRYTRRPGSRLRKSQRALSILSAMAIISTTFVVATASPAAAACDYKDAGANNGWGWDSDTHTSCAPRTADQPPQNNCDYSAARANGGWGWDPVTRTSCPPQLSATPTSVAVSDEVANVTVIRHRLDSSGQRAIVSETDDGNIRVVHVDPQGRTNVIQFEQGSAEWELTTFHYEGRSALNTGLPPTFDEALGDNDWTLLSASQSIYHQDDSIAGTERKLIHVDGREAVYYADGTLVVDPEIAGTYNYVNPRPVPAQRLDIQGWVAWAVFGIGHLVADVIPYWIGGNVRPDDPDPGPTSTAGPVGESDLDNRDDDDDGIPAGQDLDDKDPNRGARPGTPYADDDGDGFANYIDAYPDDKNKWAEDPCAGSHSNASSCGGDSGGDSGGGSGGGLQTSNGGSVQTSNGGTVQTNS